MTRERVLTALFEDTPKSSRVIMREMGLSRGSVAMALNRLWRGGRVLRTAEAIFETERIFKGRAGVSNHMRPYHLYVIAPEGRDQVTLGRLRQENQDLYRFEKMLEGEGEASISS